MFMVPTQARASGTYYYDYTNNQTRLDLQGVDLAYNMTYNSTYLWKFSESSFYAIDYINKTCDKEVIDGNFWEQWQGIPDNASVTWGKVGVSQEVFEQYQFLKVVKKEDNEIVAVTIDVKTAGEICPPSRLIMEQYGLDPLGTFAYNYEFLDPTDIKDPKTVFSDPPHCTSTATSNVFKRNSRIHRRLWPLMG
ncbi:uncharacterized protein [Argopecten irradians]|uniref:uncharacterized protein isoform X2 n=1 Tax=Argopecten irradians TaxID=31199 RepID=UPI003722832C